MKIGIDLGGTNVRVAKVDESGNILEDVKRPSYALEGPEKVLSNIKEMIREISDYESCKGIGIGVPGPVDTYRGVMTMSTNLPGFTNYPLATILENEFHMPVFLDNDANVAGLAEALVGAGKLQPIVYYVTISTGIGGALVVNGRVVSGKSGYAGEVGNLVVDKRREKVNHLNIGAVECEASGTAIVRKARAIFGEDKIRHAGDLFELAQNNNEEAIKLVDQMTTDLAYMFSYVGLICDPCVFVIGGGVMKSKEYFLPQVVEKYKALVHPGMRNTPFVQALLDEPGVIGAAMLPVSMKG